jgi:hypothetical protein
MTTRSASASAAGLGRARLGARPARASAASDATRSRSDATLAAPTKATPRGGGGATATGAAAAPTAGASGAAPTVTRALERAARRPGTCSSSTRWKFVPPKPKADSPAWRTPPGGTSHARSVWLTTKGVCVKSMAGFGRVAFKLGGSALWWSASAVLRSPAAPAAPLRWPMLDLTEPSATAPDGRSGASSR